MRRLSYRNLDWIQLTLAVAAAAVTFFIPLPAGFGGERGASAWPRFAQGLLTALCFVFVIFLHRGKRSVSARYWLVAAAASLTCAAASLIAYRLVAATSTCSYYDQTRIIGREMTPLAADYVQRYPNVRCEDLLKAFTGHAEEIWTDASRLRSEVLLGVSSALILPLASLGVLALIQSFGGNRPPRRFRRQVLLFSSRMPRKTAVTPKRSSWRSLVRGIAHSSTRKAFRPAATFTAGLNRRSESDLMVFLISPDSVASGGYALTELKFAREKWPHPKGRVLPVMVRATALAEIPQYLAAVTFLKPEGNIAAETARAVEGLAGADG